MINIDVRSIDGNTCIWVCSAIDAHFGDWCTFLSKDEKVAKLKPIKGSKNIIEINLETGKSLEDYSWPGVDGIKVRDYVRREALKWLNDIKVIKEFKAVELSMTQNGLELGGHEKITFEYPN